jgi:hypothetical protein
MLGVAMPLVVMLRLVRCARAPVLMKKVLQMGLISPEKTRNLRVFEWASRAFAGHCAP